jgi:membrane fusion protein, multidrug efflux system
VQRIPVRISLDAGGSLTPDLRPGMSVTPTIDTKQAKTAIASAQNRID